MKINITLYLAIGILLFIILAQNKSCDSTTKIVEKKDTVTVYDTIVQAIPGKTRFINSRVDTSIWIKKAELKPDTTYAGLSKQYISLGNSYYSARTFKTDFKIANYGSVTFISTIKENNLINSTLETNLIIPTTTITIEKETPPKMILFGGISFTGNKNTLINCVYGDLLLKTKKNKIYNISIGYTNEINYKIGLYYPLKFKK